MARSQAVASGVGQPVSAQPASVLVGTAAFGAPLLVLALGHMLSNMLRTLPAIATDVMAVDIGVSAEALASLTGAYHFAFAAGQIPVGVALDRYGVRTVSLTLFAIVTVGAALAAVVGGAAGFFLAQIVLGVGCCGMLLCPMTLAAKLLTPAKFGLWSGLIQGVGNSGMLLSASPLAWLIEMAGWRAGYGVAAIAGVVIAGLVFLLVPNTPPERGAGHATLRSEAREVVQIGLSARMRGIIILALVSFAVMIGIRGLWGGPWLMDVKGLSRVEAGAVLMPLTIALVLGPIAFGMLDRRIGHRRALIIAGHAVAGAMLLLLAMGGPAGTLSRLLGEMSLPVTFDTTVLFIFGATIAVQPLLFAMGRSIFTPDKAGKALAAINFAFFAGAAIFQPVTGAVSAVWGTAGVIVFLGLLMLTCTLAFALMTERRATGGR
ncbi:MFS transporter [Chelatococcus asaccharovorans]|uniref:Sugar phosphate permease n=1 Tax=Chelatococcus asaccharovorans TaxID=28210 RepID=A0A2V3UGV2_9HYPH|nr:MFS transporter [Chelatococcus asaccharovorans]MBS7701802.1 MFS transporter [Chelatococcus asaccharovorans]PXW64491.1 sugar phosphate permease [Chelatococcus asaccharovorans]